MLFCKYLVKYIFKSEKTIYNHSNDANDYKMYTICYTLDIELLFRCIFFLKWMESSKKVYWTLSILKLEKLYTLYSL